MIVEQPKKSKKSIYIALIAVMVFSLTAAFGYYLYREYRTVIQVGNQKISYSKYQTLIDQAKKDYTNKDIATQKIIDSYKYQQAAVSSGIVITTDELADSARAHYVKNAADLNEWQLLNAKYDAIKLKIDFAIHGGKKIAFLNFPFCRYFSAGQESHSVEFGKPETIAADKKYAYDLANKIHEDIIKNPRKLSQYVSQVQHDNRLNYGVASGGSYLYTLQSDGKISRPDSGSAYVSDGQAVKVFDLSVGVTPISTEKTTVKFSYVPGYELAGVDIAYYFYVVEGKKDPVAGIEAKIQTNLNKLKVKKNV